MKRRIIGGFVCVRGPKPRRTLLHISLIELLLHTEDRFGGALSCPTIREVVTSPVNRPEPFSCKLVVAFGCERNLGGLVMGRGLLLWLLGIPLPIILLVWLLGGLHG
jgi:hypothetical protein